MGKRKLYPTMSTLKRNKGVENLMNFLQYSDGKNTLENISKKIRINFKDTQKVYYKLKKYNLIY